VIDRLSRVTRLENSELVCECKQTGLAVILPLSLAFP
jgi:hypothetical protein